ncbi:hypothetical protein HYS47_03870 [Candidatus Woesearchaeota archaeon]|nr:hypothetical protein [Candidatus Woesearchaeota archaeon]
MGRGKKTLLYFFFFLLGWAFATGTGFFDLFAIDQHISPGDVLHGSIERYSPSNHIDEEKITVFPNQVIISLDNAGWAVYDDTNSMDPVLDDGAHGIEITPLSEQQIQVGDIMSYRHPAVSGLVVHRVIDLGHDKQGWYAKTKGDNTLISDSDKVRFNQVHGVLVGILY